MKRFFLILILLLFLGNNAYALQVLIGETISGYNIVDYHQTDADGNSLDEWRNDFLGYEANTGDNFTGFYLGTVLGANTNNGQDDLMTDLINYYLDTNYDSVNVLSSDETNSGLTYVTTRYTDGEETAGTWFLSLENEAINFYAVKGSNSFALYYVSPAMSEGLWTTAHLTEGDKLKELSHLAATTTPAPVPEPATMFLLGTGLIGLAGFRRKKK